MYGLSDMDPIHVLAQAIEKIVVADSAVVRSHGRARNIRAARDYVMLAAQLLTGLTEDGVQDAQASWKRFLDAHPTLLEPVLEQFYGRAEYRCPVHGAAHMQVSLGYDECIAEQRKKQLPLRTTLGD